MHKERMILSDLAEIAVEETAPIVAQMACIHLRLAKRSMGKVGEREAGKGGDRLLDIAHGAEKLKTSTPLDMPSVIRTTSCLGLRRDALYGIVVLHSAEPF